MPRPDAPLSPGAVVFVLLFVALGCWALATPLFGAPDEPAHAVRAASVARGQLLGSSVPGLPRAFTTVDAPVGYRDLTARIGCWITHPDVTPACAGAYPARPGSDRRVPTLTYAGRYPPAYYLAVGLPARAFGGAAGLYVMRLASAAMAAALLTAAVVVARRSASPGIVLLGLAAAVTPAAAFLFATVNPSALEVAAAICLWVAGLAGLERAADPDGPGWVLGWAVAAACALALARGLSLVWLALILGLQVLAVGPRRIGSARGRPGAASGGRFAPAGGRRARVGPAQAAAGDAVGRLWRPALLVAGAGVLAGAWLAVVGGLSIASVPVRPSGSTAAIAGRVLARTGSYLKEMVGGLQWLDTPVPRVTHLLWAAAVAGLVVPAVVVGSRRPRLALLACAGLTLAVPLLQVPGAKTAGLVWQGRYALPLAAGIPVLAAHALGRSGRDLTGLVRRAGPLVAGAVGLGLVASFVWAARRNTVGASGPLLFLGRERWQPPVPEWLLGVVFVTTVSVLLAMLVRVLRLPGGEAGIAGAAGAVRR